MAFENPYLVDFAPIFFSIIKEKDINPAKAEIVIFDEEVEESHPFEQADVLDVLNQLREHINALTVYTNRQEYFFEFAECAYEENGLVTAIKSKKEEKKIGRIDTLGKFKLILDFERRGQCYYWGRGINCGYIPIYKKPWEIRENLDIVVPFGYNTVIVKGKYTNDRKYVKDRFEEGFYRDE